MERSRVRRVDDDGPKVGFFDGDVEEFARVMSDVEDGRSPTVASDTVFFLEGWALGEVVLDGELVGCDETNEK